jgi:hypothetical protein
MKKIYLIYILAIFLFITIIPNTYASNICTNVKFEELQRKASKISANYELRYDNDENHYFKIILNNVDKDLLIIYNDSFYEPKDGKIELENYFESGQTYEFRIYGGENNPCVEEYIASKKITMPKYNIYSELDECQNHKDIPICDKYYDVSFDSEEAFKEKLNEYLKKDEQPPEDNKNTEEKEDNTTVIVMFIIIFASIIAGSVYMLKKNDTKKKREGNKNEKE